MLLGTVRFMVFVVLALLVLAVLRCVAAVQPAWLALKRVVANCVSCRLLGSGVPWWFGANNQLT